MSSLTICDETRFNRDLRVLMAGGLSSGLVGALMTHVAGGQPHAMMALSFAGMIGLFAALSDGEGDAAVLKVFVAMLGGGIVAAAFPNPVFAAVLGGVALGAALSLDRERRDMLGSTVAVGLALGTGVFSSMTLLESGVSSPLDLPLVEHLARGGIWGTFSALGAGAHRIRWRRDPHLDQLHETIEAVGDDESHYLFEAEHLYELVRREAEQKDAEELEATSRRIASNVLEAMGALARRSNELREALRTYSGDALDHRIEHLEQRLERTSEPSVQRELEAVREDLVEQRNMHDRIGTAITRLELRQQRCVTALERLHIHLIEEGSIEAAERGLDASLEDLEEMAEEISWRNLSVEELCDPFEGEWNEEVEGEGARRDGETYDFDLDLSDIEGERSNAHPHRGRARSSKGEETMSADADGESEARDETPPEFTFSEEIAEAEGDTPHTVQTGVSAHGVDTETSSE